MANRINPSLSKLRSIASPLMGCAFLALTLASTSHAQSAPPSHAKIELIADEAASSKTTAWVGLLFDLDSGWHVYWQNAGDSGTPPKVAWQLPTGYRAGAIRWPTPMRLGSGSVIDYGYEDQVLLMAPIERAASATAAAAIPVAADVKYVVCREVCIPGKAHLTLSLPAAGGAPPAGASQWHAIFESTRAQLPTSAPASWKISAASEKKYLVLSVQTETPVENATFFPLESGQIENSAPQTFRSTKNGFHLTIPESDQLVKPIWTLRGVLVLGPGRAYDIATHVLQASRIIQSQSELRRQQ
jgi:DsbC/DsbD-like thiol-disulfide interchange protein